MESYIALCVILLGALFDFAWAAGDHCEIYSVNEGIYIRLRFV